MNANFHVGQYILEKQLGEGGMAEVWLGRNAHLGTPAAIKFLNSAYAGKAEIEERFRNEGRRQGLLNHPNIIKVYGFEYVGNRSFLILQFIDGESLADVLGQGGRLELAEAARLGISVLNGLHHAHENNIVHRDVKPSNILLDANGFVYLGDFGIVLATNEKRITRTGTAMGTALYMSPEQIKQPSTVDRRSDIYSFGCVLYEMLTGAPPFNPGRSDQGDTDFAIKLAHIQDTPPPLRERNPLISEEVESVVLRCLAKKPDDRYSTCRELRDALSAAMVSRTPSPGVLQRAPRAETLLEIEPPIPVPAPEPIKRTERATPRRRTLAYATWVFVLLPMLLGFGLLLYSPRTPSGGTTWTNPKDGLTYVRIPPGTFTMGCSPGDNECGDSEKPAHQVTITKGYWIGQTEVTQAAYERVIGSNPSHFKGTSLPVDNINVEEARAYCVAAGMRLPTEAEWEYAARGGTASVRYGTVDSVAWYSANSGEYAVDPGSRTATDRTGQKTHKVGQKQPNAYGLYDMLGNVYEWVADLYGSYGSNPVNDPQGPSNGQLRPLRGGSWAGNSGDARASDRGLSALGGPDGMFGVRCAGN